MQQRVEAKSLIARRAEYWVIMDEYKSIERAWQQLHANAAKQVSGAESPQEALKQPEPSVDTTRAVEGRK